MGFRQAKLLSPNKERKAVRKAFMEQEPIFRGRKEEELKATTTFDSLPLSRSIPIISHPKELNYLSRKPRRESRATFPSALCPEGLTGIVPTNSGLDIARTS
ncbi:hypothetical protein L195_g026010 [Trifolium pratense]|uniref:Uncharacterized protein n=1 Tax=Trifolium pratense TaxID=57577 RepID=A0A2K3NI29_TRIPR|nr:hypothetical protein L195_g026010 [Trifolium pratense]